MPPPDPFLLDDNQEALLSAAHRHLRDAEHLAAAPQPATSPDQAYHLAGFAPECARKSTLQRTFRKAIGHGVQSASEKALEMALASDPVAHRYDLLAWRARYPALESWNEACRYEKTGTRGPADVRALLGEARDVVDRISLALWLDGRIRGGFSW